MIEIRDKNGRIRFSTPINNGSKRKFQLMKEDYITLKFSVDTPIHFALGDGIDNELGVFELIDLYKPVYNKETGGYDYDLRLDAYYWKWKNKKFFYTPEDTGKEASWNLTATLETHLNVFLDNLKALGYQFRGQEFTLNIDDTVGDASKFLSYNNINLIDALTQMAEAWECEWWMTDGVINFGRCEYSTPVDFKAGDLTDTEELNVSSMQRSDSQTKYATRVYAFGSTRNIPANYRKELIFDVTIVDGLKILDSSRLLNIKYFPLNVTHTDSFSIKESFDGSLPHNTSGYWFDRPITAKADGGIYHITSDGMTISLQCPEYTITFPLGLTITKRHIFVKGTYTFSAALVYRKNGVQKEFYMSGQSVYLGDERQSDYSITLTLPNKVVLEKDISDLRIRTYIYTQPYKFEGYISSHIEYDIKSVNGSSADTSVTFLTGASAGKTFDAIYNPDLWTGEDAKILHLSEGAIVSSGDKYIINNLIRGKVPDSYFTKDDKEMTLNSVVQKHLMLPEGISYVDAYRYSPSGKRIEIGDAGYDDPGNKEMPEEEAIEEIVIFENEYPKYTGSTAIVPQPERGNELDENDQPTGNTYPIYTFKDTGLRNFTNDFRLAGQDLRLIFQTGKLAGLDFEINIEEADNSGTTFTIIRNEDYGRYLPDDTLFPQAAHTVNGEEVPADTYILYGFDTAFISEQMVPDAEQELLKKAHEYVKKSMIDPSTYTCEMNSDYIYNEGDIRTFEPGHKVNLINKAFFESGRQSRIIGFEWNLDIPFDRPVYTIGETAAYSRFGEIESKLDSLTYNGQMYSGVAAGGGGGTSVYVIGQYDRTLPSDRNVFSSKKALGTFLNKTKEEQMEYLVRFLGGIEVGEFAQGSTGVGVYQDDSGNWHLESDCIDIRMKLTAKEVEIQRTTHIGGSQMKTAAAMTCIRVEEFADAYRCYMQVEDADGNAVHNEFKELDQALVETFNMVKQADGMMGNHFLWRLVTSVGPDYIDLSKDIAAAGSDAPQVGDKIIQLGYRGTDGPSRQSAVIDAGAGAGAPYYRQYTGINSFSLPKPDTQLKPGDNELAGVLHIKNGSTGAGNLIDLPEEISNAVKIGSVNLLLNSGFTGDYDMEQINGDTLILPDAELYSRKLKEWTGIATVQEDLESCSDYSAAIGSISQNVSLIEGESYVISYKAKGEQLTVSCGGFNAYQSLTPEYQKYTHHFIFNGTGVFMLSGTATVCDLQLERGTIVTDYKPSPLDNDKSLARYQSLSYIASAIKDGSIDILGGLILANMLKLGNYTDGVMKEVTAGISGIYNDGDDVAFWAGGTFEKAIQTVMRLKYGQSTPTEEEWKELANFVATHEGDVFLKGYIYALGGIFKGKVDIGNGKILFNEDGSGHLLGGLLKFTSDNKFIIDLQNFKINEEGNVLIQGFVGGKFSNGGSLTSDKYPSSMNYVIDDAKATDFSLPNEEIYIGSILTIHLDTDIFSDTGFRIGFPGYGGCPTYRGQNVMLLIRNKGTMVRLMATKFDSGVLRWEILNFDSNAFALVTIVGGNLTILDKKQIYPDRNVENLPELWSYWDTL